LRIIKKITFYILHFTFYISLLGCVTKTVPVYAVVKTPEIKLADQGFLKEGFGYKQLIIYKDANIPVTITVKNSEICIRNSCMDKATFVKKYISKDYDTSFFDKLLEFKCPLGGVCKKNGNSVLFKDKKHKILILLKKIN